MCRKAIAKLVAIVVIVALCLALGIFIAFWILGILGIYGYGTRPILIGIHSFWIHGSIARIMMKNYGSEKLFIDEVRVNDLSVEILTAYDYNTMYPVIYFEDTNPIIEIDPGQTIEIWIELPGRQLAKPGVSYKITIHTVNGFSADFLIVGERGYIVPPYIDVHLYNQNFTIHLDLARLSYEVYKGSPEARDEIIASGFFRFVDTFRTDKLDNIIENKELTKIPLIVIRNAYTSVKDLYFFVNHPPSTEDPVYGPYNPTYYYLHRVKGGVPYMDFLILFEGSYYKGWRDYDDHVTRVVWLKNGTVLVEVYYNYYNADKIVFYVGGREVYEVQEIFGNLAKGYYGAYGAYHVAKPCSDKIFVIKP